MNCPSCNAEVTGDSVYCPKCGHRLSEGGDDPAVGARVTAEATGDGRGREHADSASERFRNQLSSPVANKNDDDDQEIELWEGGYSPKAMFTMWAGAAVLTVLLLVGLIFFWFLWYVWLIAIAIVWIWPACLLAYRRLAIRYRLTSQRFIHEHGVLSRLTDRIEVIDIDDVSFRQSLIDRMVNVGTIRIESGDRSHPELVLKGIDDVQRVSDMIDAARRKERVRRGIHIASAGGGSGL